MHERRSSPGRSLLSPVSNESAYANWQEAITRFYLNYRQLLNFLQSMNGRSNAEAHELRDMPFMSEVRTLTKAMHRQLERLAHDIDRFSPAGADNPSAAQRKLVRHTQVLNRLNQQAHDKLSLIGRDKRP